MFCNLRGLLVLLFFVVVSWVFEVSVVQGFFAVRFGCCVFVNIWVVSISWAGRCCVGQVGRE